MQLRLAALAALMGSTIGCATTHVQHQAAAVSVPAGWSGDAGAADRTTDAGALASWWATFNDPVLTRLIEASVTGNRDVRTALSRIRQARAAVAVTAAGRRPSVNASGSTTTSRSSGESGSGSIGSLFQGGFDASWEIDAFGLVRDEIVSAQATEQAREADLADALVTLAGDVATAYVNLRSAEQRLAIARESEVAQRDSYEIAGFRQQAGLTTELDVDQALANLESTRASIAALEPEIVRARHTLALLLGETPGTLDRELEAPGAIPTAPISVAVGIPAETLRRRPDVRSAERALAAQAATSDAKRAELYPKFRLAGSIGLQALNAARLFLPGAAFWSASPSVSWQLFDREQLRQNLAAQVEVETQAMLSYESKVLSALRDVEDALADFAGERVRMERLTSAAAAANRAADLARQLYASGLRDFRDVLDAQRTLLSLQDQLAASQTAVAIDLIKTYKALGGGWTGASAPPIAGNH
jgi:NodT family efflux transporter outer membrane factor (OMF) lipoprotein